MKVSKSFNLIQNLFFKIKKLKALAFSFLSLKINPNLVLSAINNKPKSVQFPIIKDSSQSKDKNLKLLITNISKKNTKKIFINLSLLIKKNNLFLETRTRIK